MESTVAIHHPMDHEHQMPVAEAVRSERTKAKTTRRIRSVKVAVMNWRMALTPRRMPSAINLADTMK